MRILRAVLSFAGTALLLYPATAMAGDSREASTGFDLTTTARTCHVGVSMHSRDQVLVQYVPGVFARVHTGTSASCDPVPGLANPAFTSSMTTYEYAVEPAPRAVMSSSCINDPTVTYYCYTDDDYTTAIQGVRYEGRGTFLIQLPPGEGFTSVPAASCKLPNLMVPRWVSCSLAASLVTHSVTDG